MHRNPTRSPRGLPEDGARIALVSTDLLSERNIADRHLEKAVSDSVPPVKVSEDVVSKACSVYLNLLRLVSGT